MKTMSVSEMKEYLNNGMRCYNIPEKYFVVLADKRMGKTFAIASSGERGEIYIHSQYMTYDEFNTYLFGYGAALENKFNL